MMMNQTEKTMMMNQTEDRDDDDGSNRGQRR